uniref:Uncharacterized protein n=1 Tax=Panagrolaimus sp. ES5 TaxID=591445 RepID=A0AC34FMZ3_9BILA
MSSNLVKVDKGLINNIKKLARGNIKQQIKACKEHLCKKVFPDGYCCDPSVIPELLPLFIKFMDSNNAVLQKEGAYFIQAVACSSNEETDTDAETTEVGNTELAIKEGALPGLMKLLSSPINDVLSQSFDCLNYIFDRCPNNVMQVVDHEVLTSVYNVFHRLFVTESRLFRFDQYFVLLPRIVFLPGNAIFSELLGNLKLYVLTFVKNVTSLNDTKIDMIIGKGFVPIVVTIIKAATTTEVQIESIKIIENIIKFKKDFVETLITDNNIIAILLADKLNSGSIEFLQTILSTLCTIFNIVDYKELSRQKFEDCGGPRKINKLLAHENQEIRDNSNLIKDFVDNDVKPPPVRRNVDVAADTSESNDDDDDDCIIIEEEDVQREVQNRKRSSHNANTPNGRSKKRSKLASEPSDTESSVSAFGEHHDFDDLSNNPSPSNAAGDNDQELYNNNFDDINSPPSSSIPISEPALPEAANTGADQIPDNHNNNDSNSRASSTVSNLSETESKPDVKPRRRFELELPGNLNRSPDDTPPPRNAGARLVLNFYSPSEYTLIEYCQLLKLNFNCIAYREFMAKIKFQQIRSDSKPDKIFPINDNTGFGCFSVLFTGTEESAESIKETLNGKLIDKMKTFDKEKIKKIMCLKVLMDEHLESIVAWLKCRVMVYYDGSWQHFGNPNSDETVPLFVLKKEKIQGVTAYQIVLSLKTDN